MREIRFFSVFIRIWSFIMFVGSVVFGLNVVSPVSHGRVLGVSSFLEWFVGCACEMFIVGPSLQVFRVGTMVERFTARMHV